MLSLWRLTQRMRRVRPTEEPDSEEEPEVGLEPTTCRLQGEGEEDTDSAESVPDSSEKGDPDEPADSG